MNRFQKVMARVLGLKAEGFPQRAYTLQETEFVNRFGTPTYAGRSVTEQSAMQVTAAWACVRIIAETLGSLPCSIYRRDAATGNSVKVNDHALSTLLTAAPNADMTSVEFREALGSALALHGNFYALRDAGSGGNTISLYPLDNALVTPKRHADTGEIVYEYADRGKQVVLPRDKVWHVKGFGTSGLLGLSPIAYARQSLGTSLAAEEFQSRFFANGANPSWLISIPQWLESDQRVIARENIAKLWQGLDNAHRAAILEGGMTATAATMPLQDAQFMELRGFGIQEICRIYRIPPHMVADLSRSTNNNIEHQGHEFVTYAMTPYLTRIEASIARWLMSPADRAEYFFRFNVDGLLRADAAGRAALYSSALQNGWMSRNEVRALENRNSVDEEGMDDYTAQSNLLPVEVLFDDERRPGTPTAPGAEKPDAEEPKAAPPAQSTTTNITLPEAMEHKLLQSIEVPGVLDLTRAVITSQKAHDAAAKQTAADLNALAKLVRSAATEQTAAAVALAAALDTLNDNQRKNRELVLQEFSRDPQHKSH